MLGEQAPLGEEVVLHRVVEVEVVLREVREDGHREVRRLGAAELERVRGDLDRASAVAAVEHLREHGLQIDRLGRRAGHLPLLPTDNRGDRAEQPALLARRLQQRAHEIGRRGLAVRARHADDAQPGSRIAVEARRDRRHRGTGRGDEHFRHAKREPALDDQRHSARVHGLLRELVPVALEAADAEEQLAAAHGAAVIGQARDLDVAGGLRRQTGGQLDEPHRPDAIQAGCAGRAARSS